MKRTGVIVMMDGNGTWGWGTWLGMVLLMAVVLGMLVGVMLIVVRQLHGRSGEDALAMLDHRLAAGQLTPAEYLERKRLLEATHVKPAVP